MNDFLIVVVFIHLFFCIKSPIKPKKNPNIILAKYGKAERKPELSSLKPRTEDMYLGPEVIRKKSPHAFPKWAITNAQTGKLVNIWKYGGTN